jgi:hypothetical protein
MESEALYQTARKEEAESVEKPALYQRLESQQSHHKSHSSSPAKAIIAGHMEVENFLNSHVHEDDMEHIDEEVEEISGSEPSNQL